MLNLKLIPGEMPGLYRCVIHDRFGDLPLYVSADLPLEDARAEAVREAERLAGVADADVNWQPELFRGEEA